MSEKKAISIANVLIYSEDVFSTLGLTTLIKFYRPSLRISHIASPQDAYEANSNKVRFVIAVATQTTNLMSLMNTMQFLREAKPDLPCLLLSDDLDPVLPALMPDIPTLCLNTPIRHIYESISRLLSRKGAASPRYSALPLLTHRQREVLCLLASGASAQDVSTELGISLKTAYVHRRDILMRLNISPSYYRGVFTGRLS
ncbi:LuxR C-terminal-related transcriptional regulator [Kosakonia sacchari]|uniref:helix-turn-helix domain-containing protein n=1 Tax=Kosakonia sacchari TaxID=1158459 RepID=UPI0025B0E1D3|nr:LuxR C-terminal-related transcriptional regulator [Kosakonia sacchari]MDN2485651.1 LuxR C-terminal-related transcriptional regulator [Kosakonia sacchari]